MLISYWLDFVYNQNMILQNKLRIIASVLIGIVFTINIQAGIDFYFNPEKFTSAYELSGVPGEISVAGVGLLFIMWNVPYAFALCNPIKNRNSLLQATIMQAFGLIGETALLYRFSAQDFPYLASSIKRFIIFDSAGLILLFLAGFIIYCYKKEQRGVDSHAV
ncbi:MAG: hypothetical protein IH585_17275 [Anaerolineaceae bacterium]|nr:hypothetical protein [Anaerolineaceae bacterium]